MAPVSLSANQITVSCQSDQSQPGLAHQTRSRAGDEGKNKSRLRVTASPPLRLGDTGRHYTRGGRHRHLLCLFVSDELDTCNVNPESRAKHYRSTCGLVNIVRKWIRNRLQNTSERKKSQNLYCTTVSFMQNRIQGVPKV